MLVLSRKCNESVVVGDPRGIKPTLKVTVLTVRGEIVKLGFEADVGLPIHRSEVWERISSIARARLATPAA
jgi:carbon storage regulator CsrA